MPRGNNSEFFSISFISTGSDSHRKFGEIRKSYFAKVKKTFFAVFFILVIFLTIIHFSKQSATVKIKGSKKTKRHLTTTEFDEHQNDSETRQSEVEIVPENRRMNRHPNHRYVEDKIERELINESNGRFEKQQPSKIQESGGNIQNVILKGKLSDRPVRGQNKFLNEMLKDSGTSMRLKGVYKQSGLAETESRDTYSYSKEINNLMQNNSGSGRKRFLKNSLRGRGVPFQLPSKGRDNLKRQKQDFRFNLKKRPITIYLDFYPMDEVKKQKKINGSQSKFSDSAARGSVNIHKFLLPGRKQNGMIMKLNLYPRERNLRKSHLRNNKKVERKSFGWFSKPKKKKTEHGKKCSFEGLHPNEKHITAKWKNEKGEWIHANHVIVKYLKKGKNSNKKR